MDYISDKQGMAIFDVKFGAGVVIYEGFSRDIKELSAAIFSAMSFGNSLRGFKAGERGWLIFVDIKDREKLCYH
jgi:hypothetical protein